MYHSPEGELVCYLFVELSSALSLYDSNVELTHMFSSAGNNHCNLGLNIVTKFLNTTHQSYLILGRKTY
jgi:hypothetical protein